MILLITYLVGYALVYPKTFVWALEEFVTWQPYCTGDVVFSLFMATIINFFYPAILLGIILNNLVLQPFISYLNRSE